MGFCFVLPLILLRYRYNLLRNDTITDGLHLPLNEKANPVYESKATLHT